MSEIAARARALFNLADKREEENSAPPLGGRTGRMPGIRKLPMALTLDEWLRVGSLVISGASLFFAVSQWRKRVRLHVVVSAFLHGLKAAAEMAKAEPMVVQINDRLTKLKLQS